MKFGAGAFLLHDNSVLLAQRSAQEHAPHTWCCFGGCAEDGEDQIACMIREVREEASIDISRFEAVLIDEYREPGFTYYTYAVVLDEAVTPVLTEEAQNAGWFPLGKTAEDLWQNLPAPLHDGVAELIRKSRPSEIVLRMLSKC